MEKKYLAKIIANDQEGLQMISACSAGAKFMFPLTIALFPLINI